MYVKHQKGDSLRCQHYTVCAHAALWGFVAVIDCPIEPKPVGSEAALTWLRPAASCNLPYFLVAYNRASPSFPLSASDIRFEQFVAPLFAANATNVSISLGPAELIANQWFVDCRAVGSFYQVWQWFSVALCAAGVVLLGIRIVRLLMELKSLFTVPVWACCFAFLALFYQLLRNAVNPSNCYGLLPAWSSEVDAFFFTADIPAVLSSLLLLAFYQLEVLQPKRLQGPVLKKLKIPCVVLIGALFALQLIVFCVVQTGQDVSGGAVVVQAVLFLICYVALLAFYLYATVRLMIAVRKSPQQLSKRLKGPLILAHTSILSSIFAFAAAGIVLADMTYTSANFVLLEVLSDLSTLSACLGIALVIRASPPRSKLARMSRSETVSKLQSRLRSFSSAKGGESSSAAVSPRTLATESVPAPAAEKESIEREFSQGIIEL